MDVWTDVSRRVVKQTRVEIDEGEQGWVGRGAAKEDGGELDERMGRRE